VEGEGCWQVSKDREARWVGGSVIQVDIGGHPPFPTGSK
jgi:hypothetical protein